MMGFFYNRPRVPSGRLVFAIGDIHGRRDLLAMMRQKIHDYCAAADNYQKTVIFLGDYIDRGPDSAAVIDEIMAGFGDGFDVVCLRGNHEQMALDFLRESDIGGAWLDYNNGGRCTLASYGVEEPKYFTDMPKTQQQFKSLLPAEHLEFLAQLPLHFTVGDYFFTHAGVHPNRAIDKQLPDDLLWIREPFLSSNKDYGKVIVHGHTIVAHPEFKSNRIAIDTGAYWSGVLSAVALHEDRHEFLQVKK